MEFSCSLKKNSDFAVVYQNGTSKANRYLVMYIRENTRMENRLGISVSKKVGNSVVRHRITRLIREAYRLNEKYFQKGLDLVVIARPSARSLSFAGMEEALLHLSRISGITNPDRASEGKMP